MEPQVTPQPQTPPVPPAPPTPQIKNSLVLIMSILLIIAVTIASLFYFQIQKLSKELSKYQIQPSPTPTATPDETANWKTYQNEKYGFEVKYPLDFTEQKAESDTTLLSVTKTDRGSSYNFMIYIRKNYKVNQIISGVEEAKEINIGDHLGYEYFYTEGAGTSGVALIQVGQDALSINFDCIGDDHNFTSPDDKKIYVQGFFDQILSTFKFIDSASQNDKNLTKEECAHQGGLWRKWGLSRQEYCQIPVSDGGKSCTDGSQCSLGNCIAKNGAVPGECQTYRATFGCITFVKNGVADKKNAVCVD